MKNVSSVCSGIILTVIETSKPVQSISSPMYNRTTRSAPLIDQQTRRPQPELLHCYHFTHFVLNLDNTVTVQPTLSSFFLLMLLAAHALVAPHPRRGQFHWRRSAEGDISLAHGTYTPPPLAMNRAPYSAQHAPQACSVSVANWDMPCAVHVVRRAIDECKQLLIWAKVAPSATTLDISSFYNPSSIIVVEEEDWRREQYMWTPVGERAVMYTHEYLHDGVGTELNSASCVMLCVSVTAERHTPLAAGFVRAPLLTSAAPAIFLHCHQF